MNNNIEHNKIKIQAVNRHRLTTDGNGVTTLVGLYGCPLKCKYCINAELLKNYSYLDVDIDELVNKIMLDYCYFVATGGGITLGGGEPLLQSKPIVTIRNKLPDDVRLNIETSLNVDSRKLLDVIGIIDEFIIDIKSMNPDIYKDYTGISIDNLLNNLNILVDNNLQHKCKIRIPNIPNYTSEDDTKQSISIIKEMGFNNIDHFNYIIKNKD